MEKNLRWNTCKTYMYFGKYTQHSLSVWSIITGPSPGDYSCFEALYK